MFNMIISKEKCKILCITGTRADYPRVKSVLKELESNENFNLQIIATGSHLLKEYGYSVQEIIDDGFTINKMVPMFEGDFDSPHGMVKAVARCTEGLSDALADLNPDLVLLTVQSLVVKLVKLKKISYQKKFNKN